MAKVSVTSGGRDGGNEVCSAPNQRTLDAALGSERAYLWLIQSVAVSH